MAEASAMRRSPFTGAYVVVAPQRAAVTNGTDPLAGLPTLAGPCPFCPSTDDASERTSYRVPEEGAWKVRVVANKYPSVLAEPPPVPDDGTALPAFGLHEIVIESDAHDADLAGYDDEHATLVLRVVRDRIRAMEATPGIGWVHSFRNKGRKAGASQPHPHCQVVGLAAPMPDPVVRYQVALAHHAGTGRNLLDDVLGAELAAQERIVEAGRAVVALVPFAPERTHETWVVPRSHRGSFASFPDEALPELASVLVRTVRRVLAVSRRTDYNLVFRLPPVAAASHPASFWVLEIVPRGVTFAGFELVTGSGVVAVTPEEMARLARAVDPSRA